MKRIIYIFILVFFFRTFKTMDRLIEYINTNNIKTFQIIVLDIQPKYQQMFGLVYELNTKS